jgi:hypothetical protein
MDVENFLGVTHIMLFAPAQGRKIGSDNKFL